MFGRSLHFHTTIYLCHFALIDAAEIVRLNNTQFCVIIHPVLTVYLCQRKKDALPKKKEKKTT